MSSDYLISDVVSLIIMGKTFRIKCPRDKKDALQIAASYLNDEMLKICQGDRFSSLEHIAIITALNLSHELFLERKKNQDSASIDECRVKLQNLTKKINQTLEFL